MRHYLKLMPWHFIICVPLTLSSLLNCTFINFKCQLSALHAKNIKSSYFSLFGEIPPCRLAWKRLASTLLHQTTSSEKLKIEWTPLQLSSTCLQQRCSQLSPIVPHMTLVLWKHIALRNTEHEGITVVIVTCSLIRLHSVQTALCPEPSPHLVMCNSLLHKAI